jgi:prolyl-tRNA synthetase
MTRLSAYLLPTEREAPADAEALSHKLMVRAGLVRQLGAGLWTWLPAGWRTHQRVAAIIRQEMDRIGGQELLLPLLQPAELWRRSGRYGIDELFKLKDRRAADLVLAMTHEEAVTFHAAAAIRSYRDLPQILYQFQVKERDEPRPRAGMLRTREFVMKDSYSFDRDEAGLAESYAKHADAYDRIMDRCGLEWYSVEADVGAMGGSMAHEYMAPCAAGENDVVLAPGYAANLEVACADTPPVPTPAPRSAPERIHTPGQNTIEGLAAGTGLPAGALLKAFPIVTEDGEFRLVMVRGHDKVNEIKLAIALGQPVRQATPAEIEAKLGPPGYLGPVGRDVPVLLDTAVITDGSAGYVVGAGEVDHHLGSVVPGRDFPFTAADIRTVAPGDTVNGHPIRIEPAIEVGNIFKLGTRYSVPLNATYLDTDGQARPIWMGSYGIGPARIAAAAVEQFADAHGISWPRTIAPFDVHLVTLGRPGSDERAYSDRLYAELVDGGLDTVYDDRDAGPGEKFADAELLGCPVRVTVGRRTLQAGELEVQLRRGREGRTVPLEGAVEGIRELWRSAG